MRVLGSISVAIVLIASPACKRVSSAPNEMVASTFEAPEIKGYELSQSGLRVEVAGICGGEPFIDLIDGPGFSARRGILRIRGGTACPSGAAYVYDSGRLSLDGLAPKSFILVNLVRN